LGSDEFGELDIPINLNGVVAITSGGYYGLALKSDGTVVGWGEDAHGETDVPAGLTGVVAIAANQMGSLALKGDGTVVE
jgi:alpha-tubulin suppressor-like RCC1 family protein